MSSRNTQRKEFRLSQKERAILFFHSNKLAHGTLHLYLAAINMGGPMKKMMDEEMSRFISTPEMIRHFRDIYMKDFRDFNWQKFLNER